MAHKAVARVGDQVRGHFDVLGNEVIGVITSGSGTVRNQGTDIARMDDIIFIPSHPHQIILGSPADYRTHEWRINASGKHKINNKAIARDEDGGKDADWDGYQTLPSALSIEATSTDFFCV